MSKRKQKKSRSGIGLLILLGLIVWTLWSNTAPELTKYEIVSNRLPGEFDGFRILQLSDLHDAELGENNEKLIELAREAKPDIIVLTGDMLDDGRLDIELTINTCRALCGVAPVFFAGGNHESALLPAEYRAFISDMKNAGVTVLENASIPLRRGSAEIQLIGLKDPGFYSGSARQRCDKVIESLSQLADSRVFTVALAHRSDLFDDYVSTGAELVLSGHAHGGQVRLPFIGGLYTPSEGLFPTYDSGVFSRGNTTMVVSRGIGNSSFPIRFNNRPELVLITLRSRP